MLHRFLLSSVVVLMASGFALGLAPRAAQAAVYVYKLPDGSHLISDRRYNDNVHKLVRVTHDVGGVGRYAAPQYHKRNLNKTGQYDALIKQAAARHSVDAALVKAVIHTESYFRPAARSRAGAMGLMQLMPETAALYGVRNIADPEENLEAGVRHLRYLMDKYEARLPFVLAAYNAGETAVETHQGIPPYPETERYVRKVLNFQTYYRSWF